MLKTKNETRSDAVSLIDGYDAWRRNEVENVLSKPSGGVFAIEMRVLAEQAQRFGQRARKLLAKPDAAEALSADQLEDLTAIAEEMEAAASEGATESDPDVVFAALPRQKREALTERAIVAKDKSDLFRERLRGDTRKREKGIQDPGGSEVNGVPRKK